MDKSCPSWNLEKVRPDPKRGFFPLFEYLSTKVCGDKICPTISLAAATDTTYCTFRARSGPSERALLMAGDPRTCCGHLPSGTGSRFFREMSEEQRARELAAAHQHMRLRPLKRVSRLLATAPPNRAFGATKWMQQGDVGRLV